MRGHVSREHIGTRERESTRPFLGWGVTRACETPVDTTAYQVVASAPGVSCFARVSRLTVLVNPQYCRAMSNEPSWSRDFLLGKRMPCHLDVDVVLP